MKNMKNSSENIKHFNDNVLLFSLDFVNNYVCKLIL